MTLVSIENLYHSYGTFSLKNINITIQHKQIAYLIGHSGCGKSTILKLISGLEIPKSGFISIDNQVVFHNKNIVNPEKRGVGIIFQYPSLFPHKSVIENVMFALHSMSKKEKYNIAMQQLKDVGMESYANHAPYTISGGQQQLVTIARTLAQKPKIVLLDEPFSNLDALLRRKIREQTLNILRNHNISVMVVTHDPEEAIEMADNIYVMRNGEIIQQGTPYEVYSHPVDVQFAHFFGDINRIQGKYKDGVFESAWGTIKAKGQTLFPYARPDAIFLSNELVGIRAQVKNIRFFNRIVDIEVASTIYKMRFTIALLPKKDDIIYVALDLSQVLFLTD